MFRRNVAYESHSTGGAAPTFEIGQIALADARFGLQVQLCLVAPFANGFQPTVASKNCRTDLRWEHDAASGQFGLPSIVDSDVIGVLVSMIDALKKCLVFGSG
jgi:hypothetical protein